MCVCVCVGVCVCMEEGGQGVDGEGDQEWR